MRTTNFRSERSTTLTAHCRNVLSLLLPLPFCAVSSLFLLQNFFSLHNYNAFLSANSIAGINGIIALASDQCSALFGRCAYEQYWITSRHCFLFLCFRSELICGFGLRSWLDFCHGGYVTLLLKDSRAMHKTLWQHACPMAVLHVVGLEDVPLEMKRYISRHLQASGIRPVVVLLARPGGLASTDRTWTHMFLLYCAMAQQH